MSSDTRRLVSQFDTRSGPDFHHYYTEGQFRNRLTDPSVVITVALLAVTIVYQAAHRQRQLPSLSQLLWDASISVIPARLLFALDRLMNPPLFPNPMLTAQPPTRAEKSDALRRILGMDNGGGIIGSVSQAGRRGLSNWSSAALGSRAATGKPPGLGNYDNSCYQNSILQGLASLKPLPGYLSAVSLERRLDLSPTRTVDTLRELIADLSSPSSNGRTIWTPKVLKNMSTWQQQDAQEYYSKLLDQIDNEIARAAKAYIDSPVLAPDRSDYESSGSQDSDDSGYHSFSGHTKPALEPRLARNPLEGLMAQRVACVNCGYCEGLTMIPFNCLTLTLGDLPEHDLYERLDHYTRVEPIENVECPKCTLIKCRDLVNAVAARTGMQPELGQRLQVIEETLQDEAFDEETLSKKCNITPKMRASSTKTKQVALARPPQSLVFHVNRSGFDERTGYMYKNAAAVRFPMILDLGPWCLGSSDGQTELKEGAVAAQNVEQWTLDPRASMVAGDRRPSRVTGPIYELRAVVTHQGHHENGHYVCYRRHPVSLPPVTTDVEKSDKEIEGVAGEGGSRGDPGSDSSTAPASEVDDAASSQAEMPSQWWRLSDEDAYQVDEQTVLSQGGVFMLFYDCVDHNSVLISDTERSSIVEQAPRDIEVPDIASTSTESTDPVRPDDTLPVLESSVSTDVLPGSATGGEADNGQTTTESGFAEPRESCNPQWHTSLADDLGHDQMPMPAVSQLMDDCLAPPSLSRVSGV